MNAWQQSFHFKVVFIGKKIIAIISWVMREQIVHKCFVIKSSLYLVKSQVIIVCLEK